MSEGTGAIVVARKTIESEIFNTKPDKWFKIWVFLLLQANHKDCGNIKRGQCFLTYYWIESVTKATHDQVKHCIEYLKKATMIATHKSTRGLIITILKYDYYQTLDNYHSPPKATQKGNQKPHRSHTINKNVKNDKNNMRAGARPSTKEKKKDPKDDPTPVSLEQFVTSMRASPERHIQIVGEYADEIKPDCKTRGQWYVFMRRNMRAARELTPFTDDQLSKAMEKVQKDIKSEKNPKGFITKWGLETLIKYTV